MSIGWLGAEALRRIQEAPLSEQQRFLLGECVQAYLPLGEVEQKEFEKLVATEKYAGVKAMNTTWYEKGLEQGRELGRETGQEEGKRELLRELLEERFGSLSATTIQRLACLTREELKVLSRTLMRADSLKALGLED
jgi:hypothetical protein